MNDDEYEQWIAKRHGEAPSSALTDQIMAQVVEFDRRRRGVWWLRLVQQIEHSRAARWALCGGALSVGSTPFVFLAYVAKFVRF